MMQSTGLTSSSQSSPGSEQDKTLLDHVPIVRFLARSIHRRLPSHVEIEDLYAAGMAGLWEATAKFNPAKNVRFESYAQFRVRGAILDSLRSGDWAPRALRTKGRAIQEAIRTLTARLRYAPSEDQIAVELKISLLVYQRLLGQLDCLEIGTLHRKPDQESGEEELVNVSTAPGDDPLSRCLRGELARRLAEAIEELPERERVVMTLYYYEELTRSEIGLALGVSDGRVQQIRTSAVIHLRSALWDLSPASCKSLTLIQGRGSKQADRSFKLGPAA